MKLSELIWIVKNKKSPAALFVEKFDQPKKTILELCSPILSKKCNCCVSNEQVFITIDTNDTKIVRQIYSQIKKLSIDIDIDIPETKPKVYNICTKYRERSSRWGLYAPYSIARRKWTEVINGIGVTRIQEAYICEGSALYKLRKSSNYDVKSISANIQKEYVEYWGHQITIGYIGNYKGTTYHSGIKRNIVSLAKEKYEKRIMIKNNNEIEKKKYGKVVSLSSLLNTFGWCSLGAEDFIEQYLPELEGKKSCRVLQLKELLRKHGPYKDCEYRAEVIELMSYLRNFT